MVISLLSATADVKTNTVCAAEPENHASLTYSKVSLVSKLISEKNKKLRFAIAARYPQIDNQREAGAQAFNREIKELVTKEIKKFKKDAEESVLAQQAPTDSYNSEFTLQYEAFLSTDRFISILFWASYYLAGSAHGYPYPLVLNFDLNASRKLELGDIFTPHSGYLKVISSYCIRELKKKGKDVHDEQVVEGTKPELINFESWNMTGRGLQIIFDLYQVGYPPEGIQKILIPYSALKKNLIPGGPVDYLTHRTSHSH